MDRFSCVKRLGIDEIALQKGKGSYVAVLVDLDTGEVLDLLANRTKAHLMAYFQAKGEAFCQQIELFCSDLWTGYIELAKALFVKAAIVVDRFHVFGHLQAVVDGLRRTLRRSSPLADWLKKAKWVLLKNPADLSAKERTQLAVLWRMPAFKELKHVYDLRNDFRQILQEQTQVDQAQKAFQQWLERARAVGHKALTDFVALYQRWEPYILNYIRFRVSTGIIEGINNKIKLIKRRGYGYASFENFRRLVIVQFLKSSNRHT